jgi:hypothetical protein
MAKARKSLSLNVLFIGNSFTARNDLPGLIARLTEASGHHLRHQLISVGGASLRTHWNKGHAQNRIKEDDFDYVVLQEQSTLPVKNAMRMHENVRLFDGVIRAAGAKTALYMTWARRHVPETQRAITEAYESIGRELGATVVPVGLAWQEFLARCKSPALHDKDKSHPTLAGSYLAACVFYAVMFAASPIELDVGFDGLSDQDAQLLRQAAQALLRIRASCDSGRAPVSGCGGTAAQGEAAEVGGRSDEQEPKPLSCRANTRG